MISLTREQGGDSQEGVSAPPFGLLRLEVFARSPPLFVRILYSLILYERLIARRYTMRFLVCLAFLFAAAAMLLDNHTTHYALTVHADQGTYEANPLARGLFALLGLAPGLVVSTVLATGLYIFVACTHRMKAATKILVLVLLGTIRFSAGLNNLAVISAMALLGGS